MHKKIPISRFREMGNFLFGQVLDPFALFDHDSADDTFDKVSSLADGKQRDDADAHEPGQNIGKRNTEAPDEAAVEQEGDMVCPPERRVK